jgi:hypothetical protein
VVECSVQSLTTSSQALVRRRVRRNDLWLAEERRSCPGSEGSRPQLRKSEVRLEEKVHFHFSQSRPDQTLSSALERKEEAGWAAGDGDDKRTTLNSLPRQAQAML